MECPNCGSEIEATINFCPDCGFDVSELRESLREGIDLEDRDSEEATSSDAGESSGRGAPNSDPDAAGSESSGPQPTGDSADSTGRAKDEGAAETNTVDAWSPDGQPSDTGADNGGTPTVDQPQASRSTSAGAGARDSTSNDGPAKNRTQSPPGDETEGENRRPTQRGEAKEPHAEARTRSRNQTQAQSRPSNQARPPNQPQTSANQNDGFSFPIVDGAIFGALTFVANYALVFGLYTFELSKHTSGFPNELFYQKHQVAGWLFYGAHTVKIKIENQELLSQPINILDTVYSIFSVQSTQELTTQHEISSILFFGNSKAAQTSLFGESFGEISATLTVPKMAYMAIPVIGLVLAGRTLANRAEGGLRLDASDRVKAGASIAIGYAILTAAGAVTIFSVSGGATEMGSIKPQLISAVMIMGLAYPVVAGGIGGYLADW